MTKEQMVVEVISKHGFENKWTVWFCEIAEILTESQLFNAYIVLMTWDDYPRENFDDDFWPDNY